MRRFFFLVIALIMVTVSSACTDDDKKIVKQDDIYVIRSVGDVIEVTPSKGYRASVDEFHERITIVPEESNSDGIEFIRIEGPSSEKGYHENFLFDTYDDKWNYTRGEEYTEDMLKADISNYIRLYPNIYSNPTEVSIGGYDYIRCDTRTADCPSQYYITIVGNNPCTIDVEYEKDAEVREDRISDLIESIRFIY